MMEHRLDSKVRRLALPFLAVVIALASGCGDGFFTTGGGALESVLARRVRAQIGEAELDVLEYTGCAVADRSDTNAQCKGISDGQVEVFVDGQSLIFDFSNVTGSGQVTTGSFEGFVVSLPQDAHVPRIVGAVVDAAISSLRAEELDVHHDDESVAVNFEGLDYDDSTFVKIDLLFHEKPLLP